MRVVAVGMALPGGGAATVATDGREFGRWGSADRAARRLHSECVWLGEA
ncbi:hypothetical protein [Sphaerisporangium fuscum]|nr:hypothetical protein [Sphaerisporangium fuscum]